MLLCVCTTVNEDNSVALLWRAPWQLGHGGSAMTHQRLSRGPLRFRSCSRV